MKSAKIRSVLALLGTNLFLICIALIGLELLFGDWFSKWVAPYGAVVDREFAYRQHIYEPEGLVLYRRDQFGLRGVRVPLDEVDVVTVGGSTTDQRFLSEGQTWQDVIQDASGIRVANAGVDGLSSTGHLVAVREWLHFLPGLRPRYYLHFIGVNDAIYVDLLVKNNPRDAEKLRALLEKQRPQHSLSRTIRARSAVIRSWLRMTAWLAGPPAIISTPVAQRTGPPETRARVDPAVISDFIAKVFRPNLRELIGLHGERGEHAIFVSQAGHPLLVRREGDAIFSVAGMEFWAVALAMMNDNTNAVCDERPTRCTYSDLAGELKLDPGNFYDFVHATPAGARRIGSYLADKLQTIEKVR